MLATGILSAGIVYWVESRSADLTDNSSLSAYYKTESRDRQIMYGKMGEIMDDFSTDLKDPATQAGLIIGLSGAVMAGFFFVANRLH